MMMSDSKDGSDLMGKRKFWEAPWYPTAVAICIGVVVYVVLSRISGIWEGLLSFLGYFKPVIMGCVIAYIVNPLAKRCERLFKDVENDGRRWILANVLAYVFVILFLVFALLILIPQLINSVETFIGNLDGYIASFNKALEYWGLSKTTLDLSQFISSAEQFLTNFSDRILANVGGILTASANLGKNLASWLIAFVLSIYLLTEKPKLKVGLCRLLLALFGQERYDGLIIFFSRCHTICNQYIVYNLIDSVIVGVANAILMAIFGIEYVGLISFVVAVTNLIPTFGPMIGLVISGLILLMINPIHSLIFVLITLVLQTCDAYIIKPRLFGNSLGISGLWILVGVIVGGNMFGIIGILLAVPAVAIIDFIYRTYIIARLEQRRAAEDDKRESKEENKEEE